MLLVALLLCAGLGWFAPKARKAARQRALVKAVREQGGSVEYYSTNYTDENLPPPDWLRDVLGDDFYDRLSAVTLSKGVETDSVLAPLSFSQVWDLQLDNSDITDAGLKCLKELPDLRDLDLRGTRVTDDGLENLKGLRLLSNIVLDDTSVTDAGLEHLKSLNHLWALSLKNTKITDAGLEHLKAMSSLSRLCLAGTATTSEGIKKLQRALPKCKIER